MTDKTQTQTFQWLTTQQDIKKILNQPNTTFTFKEKKRHGGLTFKLIETNNTNNQPVNYDLSENEMFYDAVDDLNNISTEEILQLQTIIQQLKKQIEQSKQGNINFNNFKYNAITIYDEKQRKNTEIDKIHEEILPIEDKIIFITTLIHIDNSITEKIIYFHQLTNDNIEVIKQLKKYGNINEYKDDFLLIEENSNHEKNIKVEPISIKDFLIEQEKVSNWKISKSEWIIFISLSLLSITLLAIPVFVPALVPIISIIVWEKTLVSIGGIGIAWIVNKGIWNIATEKTKKVEVWIKQHFYSLIRKIPFVNKRNLGKTKEELEIKKNVEKTIENLTSDKLETKLETQFKILKQELDNRKDKNPNELIISKNTINHKSNNISQNSTIESENNQNFDLSIRNTVNQKDHQYSSISKNNWNKVKCLLTT